MRSNRHAKVEPGEIICTGYMAVERCAMECRERMAVGDVTAAFERAIQTAPAQQWPPAFGYWCAKRQRFMILDGRHDFIAKQMLGFSHIFVAWKHVP